MSALKLKLSDDERARIRWSNGKRGYVVRVEFEPHWTRRGRRDVRPLRSRALITQLDAEREAERMLARDYYLSGGRAAAIPRDVEIVTVDPLGNVIAS